MHPLDARESPQEVPLLHAVRCKQVNVPRTIRASEVNASPVVAVPELLRSRTRARRRRRKRAWSVPCTYFLLVVLVYGTLQMRGRSS